MDFNMPDARKLSSLITVRDQVETEVFSLLVKIGIDPDEFDGVTFPSAGDGMFVGEVIRLRELLASLTKIEAKIAQLS